MSDGAVESLDHVIVGVRDLDAASASYAALLGRDASWRGSHPGQGTENALFRLENTYIELLAPAGDGANGDALRGRLDAAGEGLVGLAFGTRDAAALAQRLRAAGIDAGAPVDGAGVERNGRERSWRTLTLPQGATRGVFVLAIEHVAGSLPLMVVDGDGAAAVDALDHVVVSSARAEATRRLYEEQLGLRLALDRSFPERGLRLLFFRVGGVTVEIAARLDEPPADVPDALWGLAFQVRDVAAAQRRLAGRGFDVSDVRRGQKRGTRVFTVRSGTGGVATLMIGPEDGDA